MMAYFIQLADNFKSAKIILRVGPIYLLITNKTSKTFIADGGAERLQFGLGSFCDEFNAAIGQVADRARDFKTGCDRSGRVTKTNPLHAA